MGIAFVFTVTLFVGGISCALASASGNREVRKFEKQQLLSSLEILYKQPEAEAKHQQFIEGLKELDEKIMKNQPHYRYSPNKKIFDQLFKHLDKYPDDNLAQQRLAAYLRKSTGFWVRPISEKTLNEG